MRPFNLVYYGHDSQDLTPRTYRLRLRVFALNYRHAVAKGNRIIGEYNKQEMSKGGNLWYDLKVLSPLERIEPEAKHDVDSRKREDFE